MADDLGVPYPDDLLVRPYFPGDEMGINEGFNQVFGAQRTLEEWYWKYATHPEGRWITVVVSLSDIIVAHFAALPMRMQYSGGTLLAGQGADAYCLPEYRDRGVYTASVELFFRELSGPGRIQFFFGLAGPRNAEVLVRHHCFTNIGQAPLWRRRIRPRRAWLPLGHELCDVFDADAVDALWHRARRRYPWAGVRDGGWWKRRFQGRPGVQYGHLSAWRNGAPRAWVVLRCLGERMQVADWLWDGEDERAVVMLDREVARRSSALGLVFQEQWLAGDRRMAELMERLAWSPASLDNPNHMVVRHCDEQVPTAHQVGDFYLTMGDADLV